MLIYVSCLLKEVQTVQAIASSVEEPQIDNCIAKNKKVKKGNSKEFKDERKVNTKKTEEISWEEYVTKKVEKS